MRLIIGLLLLTACERAPKITDYACTVDQMKIVEQQTDYCRDKTGFISDYCYLASMDRNCEKKL